MKTNLTKILMLLIVFSATLAKAQENEPDTLKSTVARLASDMDLLKRIKISGFVQSQFQWADSAGIKSVAGGDFPTGVDKRFKVRRAEFKTMYDNGIAQVVANIDITQNGINIKDAYGKITEQKLQAFTLTAGIFNRPFGFEVTYSSSLLESPERARIIQTLFPGERDLGAMIGFQLPNASPLHFLKIEGGMFNGTGNNANDFDYQKDFIGNISVSKSIMDEKVKYGLRASYYNGGVRQATKFVYDDIGVLNDTTTGFRVDSADINKGRIAKREYMGADAQLSIDFPFGVTTLRGEYIQGTQPGTSSTSVSPSLDPLADTYIRKINGAYFYFLQNIGHTPLQLILKYDWYDPNTDVKGDVIGKAGSNLGKTDIKYTTIGAALAYRWDTNVKFTAYYDYIQNEKSKNLAGYTKDIKDDVFTLRVQYKF